jgi:hemoglobin-like flavoprotein
MPAKIFVSYSRKEAKWRRRFQAAMGSGVYAQAFELWSDDKIQTSQDWKKKIHGAIASSRIALLLVGKGFLSSTFIVKKELPQILAYRKAGRVKIFWVPIDEVTDTVQKATGLINIQAAWEPRQPLSTLRSKKKLDDALMHIGSNLMKIIELSAIGLDDSADDIRPKVAEMIPSDVVLGEPFAMGDYSVFYRAKQSDIDVAIKVLIPTPSRRWLNTDFVKRANIVKKISNSTAIEIRQVIPDVRLSCVVMDYLNVPTLKSRLEKEGKLPGELVASAIWQLVRVAADLHRMEGQPLIGPVRPSHVHYDATRDKAYISLLPIANETLESCRDLPTRLQDSRTLSYLSPERYYGKPIGPKTDQYHLALLALELLQGTPPVSIAAFADLQKKADFFKSPRSYFDDGLRLNQPALSFILARMLEFEGGDRWEQMGDLVSALQDVAKGKVPVPVKQHADTQYNTELRKNADFFRSFYRILFEKSDEIRGLFQHGSSVDEQSQKLNRAMGNILNFTRDLRTTSLGDQVDRHRSMGIKTEHFGLFGDAFIDALSEARIVDGYSQDAWRAILDPALNYMRDEINRAPA